MINPEADFTAFKIIAQSVKRFRNVWWTLWIDPGVHTGLAAVLYATEETYELDEMLQKTAINCLNVDQAFVGARLITKYTRLLEGDERQQIRTAVSVVRRIGEVFAGYGWSAAEVADGYDPRIGAGVGAETFTLMRSERSAELLAPVRVRSMFAYALEDEFGIDMAGQGSTDALTAFSDIRMKAVDLYLPGPNHVRDALAHCMLAIRKGH